MDNRIRHRAFTPEIKEHVPCSNNLKMQNEKFKVIQDIKLLSSNGLATPKALNRLVSLNKKLMDCDFCDGNCGCGKL